MIPVVMYKCFKEKSVIAKFCFFSTFLEFRKGFPHMCTGNTDTHDYVKLMIEAVF